MLHRLYRDSLALLTDLYQLTMAYAYWRSGTHQKEAAFHLFFRKNPFAGGFTIACGLEPAVDYLMNLRFADEDLAYLAGLTGNDGAPLFAPPFLDFLAAMRFDGCDLDAVPEGTVVFPHEPLLRVTGPIAQCQLLESPLLNQLNYETLIATKAARVVLAAGGEEVLEFGLRRAHGVDGGLSASRAAFVGGCAGTSNTLAGKLFGIPVKGTHAHSWVLSFATEPEAFAAYAEALPNNCVFLVDTYDSLDGVRHAVEAGRRLRERGSELIGIRLDSGDLAYLSRQARRILDEGGFPGASILASNDLDEHVIESLKQQGSQIAVWGVGTRLVTADGDPALGGVYKLTAVREQGGPWQYRLKLSEQAVKVSNPGIQQVRRYHEDGEFLADVIYDAERGIGEEPTMVDPLDMTRRRTIPAGAAGEDLLVPVLRRGRRLSPPPALAEVRRRAAEQLGRFHAGIKRFVYPHQYPVGLEQGYYDLKTRLILAARAEASAASRKGQP
ncbi:MAG TPA: nicotinate phosphoribosyltransferase [Thermoanaerobaculia bacterium]|nr:nicotinate phosphoribosyltransferase [Thermoanaerobaculia bacterium]